MKTLRSKFPTLYQIIRYGVVGVLNNLLGYGIYLLVTYFWLDPKIAISILYPIGATTAYFGHSKYSFSYQGKHTHALARYIITHLIGYGVNVLMLYLLWEKLKFPHQLVQAAAIVVVSGVLFLLFRYFVFPHSKLAPLSR
ncbi:MAG: GtrA family protein [Methylococcaceae bacterium]|nr:GtrA family protein [Methylococcaceae bacterium]